MMREYAKVSPQFWTGSTGKALRRRGSEAVIVAMYLMTAPGSNMLGLYYQPLLFMAHETGLGPEGASKGLRDCIECGFCSYDEQAEMVWVHEMACYQIGSELSSKDKRCLGVQRDYDSLPDNAFLGEFFDRYSEDFHLTNRRQVQVESDPRQQSLISPLQAPPKQGAGAGAGAGAGKRTSPAKPPTNPPDQVQEVIDLYHEVLPELPAVRLVTKDRVKGIVRTWDWVLTSHKPDGSPRATTNAQALEWFRDYFGRVRDNDFLMGRTKRDEAHRNWKCDLDFLLTERGMKHVIEKTEPRDGE